MKREKKTLVYSAMLLKSATNVAPTTVSAPNWTAIGINADMGPATGPATGAATAPPSSSALAVGGSVDDRSADRPSVRLEASPIVVSAWNRGKRRRHGRFRRTTYFPAVQPNYQMCQVGEKMETALIGEVYTIRT